jgi:hypothetical protein
VHSRYIYPHRHTQAEPQSFRNESNTRLGGKAERSTLKRAAQLGMQQEWWSVNCLATGCLGCFDQVASRYWQNEPVPHLPALYTRHDALLGKQLVAQPFQRDNRRCNDLAGGIKVVGGSSRCIKTEPPPPGRTAACQLFQYLYVLTAADSRPAQASTMGLLKPA